MTLRVLGSSSSGNCYILDGKEEALIIEAGICVTEVKRTLDYDISKVAGCLISHEHGDHAKYANNYFNSCIDIYCSHGTAMALRVAELQGWHAVKARFRTGGFDVLPFPVEHDAAEPLGFLIRHAEMGVLLFATDTYFIHNRFRQLNHILIECNYADDIMQENIAAGKAVASVSKRRYASHMELNTCKNFLKSNDLSKVGNIILLHMSLDCADRNRFVKEITELTGKPVKAAVKGLTVDLGF